MSNYVSVVELQAFKQADGTVYDLSAFSDAELLSALNEAEELIERICGTRFYAATETWLLNGDDSKFLRFPPAVMYPLISVTTLLEVDENEDTVETWVENTDFVCLPHYLLAVDVGVDFRVGTIISNGYFPLGVKNFKLTGLWGTSTTPEAIKRVTKLLALENLKSGLTGLASQEVVSESWPDYTVTYRSATSYRSEGGTSPMSTGFSALDRILFRYVNHAGLLLNHTDWAWKKS